MKFTNAEEVARLAVYAINDECNQRLGSREMDVIKRFIEKALEDDARMRAAWAARSK